MNYSVIVKWDKKEKDKGAHMGRAHDWVVGTMSSICLR